VFASAPDLVGRVVRLGGRPFEVIGVAPRDFTGLIDTPLGAIGGWIPMATLRTQPLDTSGGRTPSGAPTVSANRSEFQLEVFGRLRPAATATQAAAEMARLAASLDAARPIFAEPATDSARRPASRLARREWAAQLLTDPIGTSDDRMFYVAAALVLLVVVVACTNLANLVLARGTTRQQDFAVRRALGASRFRLVREQVAETLLITAGGAVASYLMILLFARIATRTLQLGFGFATLRIEPGVDQRTLGVAAFTLLAALIVVGLEPALQLTRTEDLRGTLADGAAGVGLPKARRHRMLLRWQVAVATAYFIIAALTIRFVVQELNHDSGIRLQGLAVAQFETPRGWDERRERALVQRLTSAPSGPVQSIAVSTSLPLAGSPIVTPSTILLSTPGNPFLEQRPYPSGVIVGATADVFKTLGVPLLQGRTFAFADTTDSARVAVVSEATARRLFGTANVVGQQVAFKSGARGIELPMTTATIVGVAGDTEDRYMSGKAGLVVYVPLAQAYGAPRVVIARAEREAAAVQALQLAIRQADPDVSIVGIGTADALLTGPYPLLRYFSNGSMLLGLVTLTLAMVGLFGIQSHGVARRTREIGVRMSLGATAAQVRRMVLRNGFRPVVDGLVLGLMMGFVGRLAVRVYLSNGPVNLFDPWMFLAVPVPVILASFCACYLPALRASRVDPNVALRHL
jgi:predicted permease